MPISPEVAHARARKAGLHGRANDDPEVIDAVCELRTATLADRIRRDVDEWPPLTVEQRSRLASLLRPDGS